MTELLQKAVAAVETLPATDLDRYAAVLLAELEAEAAWTDVLARNPEKTQRLAEEAIAEIAAGRTLPFHDLT